MLIFLQQKTQLQSRQRRTHLISPSTFTPAEEEDTTTTEEDTTTEGNKSTESEQDLRREQGI